MFSPWKHKYSADHGTSASAWDMRCVHSHSPALFIFTDYFLGVGLDAYSALDDGSSC